MRIVSGSAGGRTIMSPDGLDIRPTSDKVRGAIFNSLRSRIDISSVNVFDGFCGTGALGLEALSQGARNCVFVDKDKHSMELTKKNVDALGFKEQSKFILGDATKIKPIFETMDPCGLIFLDPPYNKGLAFPALEALRKGRWLAGETICVLEVEKIFNDEPPAVFLPIDEKIYGDTKIIFLGYHC